MALEQPLLQRSAGENGIGDTFRHKMFVSLSQQGTMAAPLMVNLVGINGKLGNA